MNLVLADAKLGPREASIFVEHTLDGVGIARSRQGEGEKPRGLVRTQVVGCDHAGLLPIVIPNDAAIADARAPHNDNPFACERGQLRVESEMRGKADIKFSRIAGRFGENFPRRSGWSRDCSAP